jgi:hypothetical protein
VSVSTGRVIDFSNADVAVDHYHRYKVNQSMNLYFVYVICSFVGTIIVDRV